MERIGPSYNLGSISWPAGANFIIALVGYIKSFLILIEPMNRSCPNCALFKLKSFR